MATAWYQAIIHQQCAPSVWHCGVYFSHQHVLECDFSLTDHMSPMTVVGQMQLGLT